MKFLSPVRFETDSNVIALNDSNGETVLSLEYGCRPYDEVLEEIENRINAHDQLVQDRNDLRNMLRVIMGNIDYTNHACGLTSMVGACLDSSHLDDANELLNRIR